MMDEAAREELAQRLSKMTLRQAVREMRNIDPDANMVFWRNAIWDEIHTLFLLPNKGVEVRLVEKSTESEPLREIGGGPRGTKARRADYEYVGARVVPLSRPAFKRGGTGPSPMKHSAQGPREGVYVSEPL